MEDNELEIYNSISNQEAEEKLIGILLTDTRRISQVSSIIDPYDFFDRGLRTIYNTILIMNKDNKPVDIVTVSEQLKFNQELDIAGGRERITELAYEAGSSIDYKQYCKILVKYGKKRKLLNISDKIQCMLNDGVDVDDVTKVVIDETNKLIFNKTSTNLSSLISGLDDTLEEIDAVLSSETGTFGLSTGFASLDKTISGLCKSKLYILAARPRVGKSSLAQQIAEYVAQRHNVLFQSLEMKSSQYTKRSIFRRAGLNTDILTKGLIDKDTALGKAVIASTELENLSIFIDDNPDCTLSTIEKNILMVKEQKGSCDLIVIDYAQLMSSDDKKETDHFRIASKNSMGLKKLANKYDVPILLLAQLSRAVDMRMDKRPLLSDLKDTGSYEQDADVVMFLNREEIYNPTPLNKGKAELIIAKNRDGQTKIINMCFNGSATEFREMNNG